MADKLSFSLVSPEHELMSKDVDQVVVPGTEGEFGVLSGHAPFMSTVSAGVLRVLDGGSEERVFVRGGFADVTAAGLVVLAEEATPVADLKGDALKARIAAAEKHADDAETEQARIEARQAADALKALAG